jgi:predicted small metal-binding protein
MKKQRTKAAKKIRGNHNLDLMDEDVYHRTKSTIKKMKYKQDK